MKTIIISEEMEKKLFRRCLKEAISEGDIRLEVFKYLDDNFVRADKTILNKDGKQENTPMIVWLDKNKQPFQTITLEKAFWMIQDEFKTIKDDKKERDEFLWNTLKSWFKNNYNKLTGNIFN